MNSRHLTLALAAAVAAATLSSGAQAEYGEERRAKAVSYADLNLALDSDAEILLDRIRAAADDICERPHARTLDERRDRQRCFRHALQSAVGRLDETSVTRAYLARFAWASAPGSRVTFRVASN